MRQVVLIAGPSCAGKSRLVATHLVPSDVLADWDFFARRLGSPVLWRHDDFYGELAEAEMQRRLGQIAGMQRGRAWVIRSAPERWRREQLADLIRADRVVVLNPPAEVLYGRADGRPDPAGTRKAIARWLRRFTPSDRDEVFASSDDVTF